GVRVMSCISGVWPNAFTAEAVKMNKNSFFIAISPFSRARLLLGQRIGTNLEMRYLSRRALAPFGMPCDACAVGCPNPAAFPADPCVVDTAVHAARQVS